jgi:dolichol-phosphate mannosyltransferase
VSSRASTLDIVVPIYNEESGLARFHGRLAGALAAVSAKVTFYYVNDGSTDASEAVLQEIAANDHRVVVINLSRNFGHQAALSAGLDASRAEVVVTIDGDGQHPPDLVPEMLRLFEHGYDVVLAQRGDPRESGRLKRRTSDAFYWLLGRIGDTRIVPGCADFRLLARPVVDALRHMPEYHRFIRGMVAWLGFRTVILPYAEESRLAGRSKYSPMKMLKLASDAISSFSLVPLRIGIALGLGFLVVALLEAGYVARAWLRQEHHLLVPGWSSLMFAILAVGGILMIILGVVGSYVGYIFQEVKRRPVYVVRSVRTAPSAPFEGCPPDGRP